MTPDEAAELTNRAKKCHQTRESYIRSIIEGRIPRETPPPDYHAMLQGLYDIAIDMRAIAHIAAQHRIIDAQRYDEAYRKIAYAILDIQKAVTLPVNVS
jgi:hypothetical protein